MEKSIFERTEKMPIPLVGTALAVCTLGNIYDGMGFSLVRFLCMVFGVVILFFYLVKVFKFPQVCKNEYTTNTVFASLYGTISMVMMITSSYFMQWIPALKYVIMFAVLLHAFFICAFLYLNLIKNFNVAVFVPSWFVTLNGIMVSTVVAMKALPKTMAMAVVIWGFLAYTICIPFMVVRLRKHEIAAKAYHTQAILLAPCSLIVASYINAVGLGYFPSSLLVVSIYYVCVLASLLFIIIKIPRFFAVPFNPGFAGLTFPMAIGIVASKKMAGFLGSNGYEQLGTLVNDIAGIQIILTTAIVAFVVFNFGKMFFKKEEKTA